MNVTMIEAMENNLRLVVEYVTETGEAVAIDGPHTVNSSNEFVARVLSQDDSTEQHEVIYELFPVAGSTILSGSADADLGEGVRTIPWSFELNVTAEEATAVRVSTGELIPKM